MNQLVAHSMQCVFCDRIGKRKSADPQDCASPSTQGGVEMRSAFDDNLGFPIMTKLFAEDLEAKFELMGFEIAAHRIKDAPIGGICSSKPPLNLLSTSATQPSNEREI